jgi:hypothetical protein
MVAVPADAVTGAGGLTDTRGGRVAPIVDSDACGWGPWQIVA